MQNTSGEYRHKAAECARKAIACREPAIRSGYAEAARKWRNLAEKKEGGGFSEPKRLPAQIFFLPRHGTPA
jgi:hypothetical protein